MPTMSPFVAEVSADSASLTTIEGNVGGCVVRKQHALDEAGLLGFGILPEQEDNGETPEEPAEPETPARRRSAGMRNMPTPRIVMTRPAR